MDDFLVRGDLAEIEPTVAELIDREAERQARKLILIPSESCAPRAVLQALGSVFNNVYAEGYPPLRMTRDPEALLLDQAHQLAYYRRYADRRFYKGVDYVHFVETLAQRRAAQAFAHDDVRPEHIYVNVQALSGAAANLGVYDALMQPGDTLMGLDLFQGGHLSHGSEFNISGKRYRVVSYGVDPKTERLDYGQIRELALRARPRVIVAGYTSYPWAPDWAAFRAIADEAGAFLLADISHPAGMAAAGVYPNPVGIAHVTTCTTHKTLMGPRGAIIMTTDEELAQKIDLAIFPGEQGGPHTNKFAALAVAFQLAQSEPFKALQRQIVDNARAYAESLRKRGLRLAYGGTDTHLLLIDVSAIPTDTGFPLRGEMAARILDLAGIVTNKNTIPGDTLTALASGIRMGTPWVTQRGFKEAEMDELAELFTRVVTHIKPFAYTGLAGVLPRGKIDLDVFEGVKRDVADLAARAGIDFDVPQSGYPHYAICPADPAPTAKVYTVSGWRARPFVQDTVTCNVAGLEVGGSARGCLLDRAGRLIDAVTVTRLPQDAWKRDRFTIRPTPANAERVGAWLRGLADGYVLFDDEDVFRKVQGPVVVEEGEATGDKELGEEAVFAAGTAGSEIYKAQPGWFDLTKPYFVGQAHLRAEAPLSDKAVWQWTEPKSALKRTPLFEAHKRLGAKMVPFAGWEMPVWYSSVGEEHAAVREAAGLFDVAHMGVFEVSGPHAISFLDTVFSSYAAWLDDLQSCYGYLLDPDGKVIDDCMIYRRSAEQWLMVVNASNEDKDWAWLNAVNDGRVVIDRQRPWVGVEARAVLRNLKAPASGADEKRDLALQGPRSIDVLQALTDDPQLKAALRRVRRTDLIECTLAGIPLVIARTGYTGEDWGYEIFVHPDQAGALWDAILEAGAPLGVKPCGLAARDSTRTEAGLPLYGHELAGHFDVSPSEAGFAGYVKYHKPFFVGRDALLAGEAGREMEIVRFRMDEKGVRRPETGDPVVNRKGQAIGWVTSCSIDREGYLLGLAYVKKQYQGPGTPVGIFVLGGKPWAKEALERLEPGARVPLPNAATILTRFPARAAAGPRQED